MNISYMAMPGLVHMNDLDRFRVLTKSVCEYFDVTEDDIKSKKRYRRFTYPRHILFYLARRDTHMSARDIGEWAGHRDHSTVIVGCGVIKNLMFYDDAVRDDILGVQKISNS